MSLKNFSKNLDLIACKKSTQVTEIARMMKAQEVGTILVTQDDRPVGIITDRDLVLRCLTSGQDCSNVVAEDIMTTPVQLIKENATILDLIEQMNTHQVRRICVVDLNENALGIVSMADVFELLSHELMELAGALGKRSEKLFRRNKEVGVKGVA